MCTTTKKYAPIIDTLEQDVYPFIIGLMNVAIHPDKPIDLDRNSILSNIQSIILVQLKDEVESLFLYEKRLVFPSIRNTYTANNVTDEFIPDIVAIKKLITHKEEKIRQQVSALDASIVKLITNNEKALIDSDTERALIKLSNYFEKDFFPARAVWGSLLDDLQNSHKDQKSSPCKNRVGGMCCCKKDK